MCLRQVQGGGFADDGVSASERSAGLRAGETHAGGGADLPGHSVQSQNTLRCISSPSQ